MTTPIRQHVHVKTLNRITTSKATRNNQRDTDIIKKIFFASKPVIVNTKYVFTLDHTSNDKDDRMMRQTIKMREKTSNDQ